MRELSKKNPYYIPGERRLELEHFCRQYKSWSDSCKVIDGYPKSLAYDRIRNDGAVEFADPTLETALKKSYYESRMSMIRKAVLEVTHEYAPHLLVAVTEGLSYDILCARYPSFNLSEYEYRHLRQKFFWTLDKIRR